jgi:hypothetical protein
MRSLRLLEACAFFALHMNASGTLSQHQVVTYFPTCASDCYSKRHSFSSMKLSSIIASSWWVMILAVQGATVQAMLSNGNLTTVLQGCYLRNLGTGVETQLTGSDSYPLNSSNLAYSIRCDVIGNETDFIKFLYDGKEHDEFGEPRWLDGDSNAGEYIVPVPYLATCGTKSIFVQGNAWSRVLFEQNFTLVAICSGPLITPAPVTAPIPRAPTPPTDPSCSFPRVRRMAGCSV